MRNFDSRTDRLMRHQEVEKVTGLGKSQIYAFMKLNLFPKPVRIGQRSVAWVQSDIDKWVGNLPEGGEIEP